MLPDIQPDGAPTPPPAQELRECARCERRTVHDRLGCRVCLAKRKWARMTPAQQMDTLTRRLESYDEAHRARHPYQPLADLLATTVGVDRSAPHCALPTNPTDDAEFLTADAKYLLRRVKWRWSWEPHDSCATCEPTEYNDEIGFVPPALDDFPPTHDPYATSVPPTRIPGLVGVYPDRTAAEAGAAYRDLDADRTTYLPVPDRDEVLVFYAAP